MLKFKIENEGDKELIGRLTIDDNCGLTLEINGEKIISIYGEGDLTMWDKIDEELGLHLDRKGQIKVWAIDEDNVGVYLN